MEPVTPIKYRREPLGVVEPPRCQGAKTGRRGGRVGMPFVPTPGVSFRQGGTAARLGKYSQTVGKVANLVGWVEVRNPAINGLRMPARLGFVPQPRLRGSVSNSCPVSVLVPPYIDRTTPVGNPLPTTAVGRLAHFGQARRRQGVADLRCLPRDSAAPVGGAVALIRSRTPSAAWWLWLCLLLPTSAWADGAGVYRWTDKHGQVHFGDAPVSGARPVEIRRFEPQRQRYKVVKVPDGDTIYLRNGDRIRLLGINAPEVAHRNRPGEAGGEEAAEALRERVLDQRVGLEFDVEKKDSYGRKLAHVFDDQGESLNQWLVERGLAFVFLHPPNLKHAEAYLAAEAEARAVGRGIWALPRYQVLPMSQAGKYRNSFRRLRGRLKKVDHKRKYSYLRFADGLTASIPKKALPAFVDAGLDPDTLVGERLVLRGWVKRYRGKPSMFLNYPQQIEGRD